MNAVGIEKVAIFGAGGHGREIAWLLENDEHFDVVCFVVDPVSSGNDTFGDVNGIPVLSWETFLAMRPCDSIFIAIGNGSDRRRVAVRCEREGLSFPSVAGRDVRVSRFVKMNDGAVIFGGALLTVNINIGSHVHINQGCSINHDVRIGDFSTLSPGVNVSGHVEIGKDVFIGTGASIINGSRSEPLVIADGTVIGAGACVTISTEANSLYAGVPAELKKRYGK